MNEMELWEMTRVYETRYKRGECSHHLENGQYSYVNLGLPTQPLPGWRGSAGSKALDTRYVGWEWNRGNITEGEKMGVFHLTFTRLEVPEYRRSRLEDENVRGESK